MEYKKLTLDEFVKKYSSEEACLETIISWRWPNGFSCPICDNEHAYRLDTRRVFQCCRCGSQTSITANTTFHQAKLPLTKWFLAIYLISANKQGISAMSLSKHLGCCYPTAWHLLHKFRKAMSERDTQYFLRGKVVVDEALVGSTTTPGQSPGRSTETKSLVIVAVEERNDNCTGSITIEKISSADSKTLHEVIARKVEQNSTIKTDAWSGYNGIDKKGYNHEPEKSLGGSAACHQFPLVHRAISNLKTWLLGTFKNFCQGHLESYVAEFSYRTNRRNRGDDERKGNLRESTLSERLIGAASIGHWFSWAQIRASSGLAASC